MFRSVVYATTRQARGYATSSEEGSSLGDLMKKLSKITQTANQGVKVESAAVQAETNERPQAEHRGSKNRPNFQRRRQERQETIERKHARSARRGDRNNGGTRRNSRGRRNEHQDETYSDSGEMQGDALDANLQALITRSESKMKALHESDSEAGADAAQSVDQRTARQVMDLLIDMEEGEVTPVPSEEKIQEEYIRRKVVPRREPSGCSNEAIRQSLHTTRALKSLRRIADEADAAVEWQPTQPDIIQMQLTKTKIPYNGVNRVLRAAEQIAARRGFRLQDAAKIVPILPLTAGLYPFANMGASGSQPESFGDVSDQEVADTVNATVRGRRPEISRRLDEHYKTEQMRVNAEVVANGLNANAQLKVDNVHVKLAPVLRGEARLAQVDMAKR